MQAFNFGKYLRRAVRHDTMEILEIDWRVWLVIMCFGIANVIRLKAGMLLVCVDVCWCIIDRYGI